MGAGKQRHIYWVPGHEAIVGNEIIAENGHPAINQRMKFKSR